MLQALVDDSMNGGHRVYIYGAVVILHWRLTAQLHGSEGVAVSGNQYTDTVVSV